MYKNQGHFLLKFVEVYEFIFIHHNQHSYMEVTYVCVGASAT